jgi:GT2 family glycosyltransferase
MAFRRVMFSRYGHFRTDLGPRPGSEIRNEDTEFGRRLLNGGELLRYEPDAIVYHPVTADRLTKEYFLHWWFDKGRADVLELRSNLDRKWRVSGVPLYMFKRIAGWSLRWLIALEPSRRFDCKRQVWALAGEIVERYRTRSLDAGAQASNLGVDTNPSEYEKLPQETSHE